MEKLLHEYFLIQNKLVEYSKSENCTEEELFLIQKVLNYGETYGNETLKSALSQMDTKVCEAFCEFYSFIIISNINIENCINILFGIPDSAVNMVKRRK